MILVNGFRESSSFLYVFKEYSIFLVLVSITGVVRFLFCNGQDLQYRKLGLIICISKISLLWQSGKPLQCPIFFPTWLFFSPGCRTSIVICEAQHKMKMQTLCFPEWLHHFTFPKAIYEGSNFSTFPPTLVIVCLLFQNCY